MRLPSIRTSISFRIISILYLSEENIGAINFLEGLGPIKIKRLKVRLLSEAHGQLLYSTPLPYL